MQIVLAFISLLVELAKHKNIIVVHSTDITQEQKLSEGVMKQKQSEGVMKQKLSEGVMKRKLIEGVNKR